MKKLVGNIFGTCDKRFIKVEEVFKKNFFDKWESQGAEVAVYYKGQLVVDLQGGYKFLVAFMGENSTKTKNQPAVSRQKLKNHHNLKREVDENLGPETRCRRDASSLVKWTNETRTVVFSVTKAVASLCIWTLIDRGRVRYDQKIVDFWPEFGKNGKESITVEKVLTHQAGLPIFDKQITMEIAKDPQQISKIIEDQTPLWNPESKKSGYHAITYGWILNEIVRRVDEKKRSLSKFAQEEIFIPHGIDFHLGLPACEEHTVSRLTYPTLFEKLREIQYDPRILLALGLLKLAGPLSVFKQAEKSADWIQIDNQRITFNDPEIHRIEQCAALGITKAKDLAKLFSLKLDGKLISKELLNQFNKPQLNQIDVAIKAPVAKGYGFFYEKHPLKRGKWLYGHPGYGGSSIIMDGESQLVIAYVTNGMKLGGGELTRTYRLLRNAALQAVQQIEKEK